MVKQDIKDVVIVGAGPGGLFAAIDIIERIGKQIKLLVIEKGKPPIKRGCNALIDTCRSCKICDLISGGGGSGFFSDGKLVYNIYSGGHLEHIITTRNKKTELEERIKQIIEKFALEYIYKKPSLPDNINRCFQQQGINFNPYPVLHIGSDKLKLLAQKLIDYLQEKNVEFLFDTEMKDFYYDSNLNRWDIKIVKNKNPQIITSNYLIASVGKEGNFWFTGLVEKLGGSVEDNNTYIGVRLEIDDITAKNLYDISFDPKISLKKNKIKLKTHCFCRHGQVLLLKYYNLPLAGGHTPYLEIDKQYNPEKFPNSNFAVLYRDPSVCTKEKALEIMKKINKTTNGKLLVQRLDDYLNNIPTTKEKLNYNKIKPSNLNIVPGQIPDKLLPGFREAFIAFLKKLDSCTPGILGEDNLLYFPDIEWWMRKVEVNEKMEVKGIPDLYAVGDGSGWTQGIMQSAATGIIAGDDIVGKLNKTKGDYERIK